MGTSTQVGVPFSLGEGAAEWAMICAFCRFPAGHMTEEGFTP
jgi:hypothetical protein